MVTIWFEPHSTTVDNEAKKASGWNDVDLSAKGVEQSYELVHRSKERKLDAIFCSDLQRAVKTAVPSANKLHLPIYPDARLRECDYGDFTLHDKSEVEAERTKRLTKPFPNGESYEQCIGRMDAFIKDLKENFDSKTVMIVGHRATHFGLDHIINNEPLKKCVSKHWEFQPGWKYELN